MAEFQALETWAADMLAKLQPAQQRRLMVDMARRLRTANSQRMRAQTDPEGQAWEPRKKPAQALRGKREQLRRTKSLCSIRNNYAGQKKNVLNETLSFLFHRLIILDVIPVARFHLL